MPQPIQAYKGQPYAEVALRAAEGQNPNQAAMGRTSAPVGPNLQDGGGMSKPSVNAQPFNNERLQGQNIQQNEQTFAPKQAEAIQQARLQQVEESGAAKKAQDGLSESISMMLYANDNGTKTFALGIPEVADRVHQSVAEAKLMKHGLNPQIPFTSNNFAA